MSVLIVLQSRISSSRLQAKAMQSLAGRPLVVLAAQRAGRNPDHQVVVATSHQAEDDIIAGTLQRYDIPVVRGPLDDTLERFRMAIDQARLADTDEVVRLTGDNPMPDGGLVEELVRWRREAGVGYCRVGGPGTSLPYGVAAEVFTAGELREAARDATTAYDHEHVTPFIRRKHEDRVAPLADVPDHWGSIRSGSVDSFNDLVEMHRLFERFPGRDPVQVPWRELAAELATMTNVLPPVVRDRAHGQGAVLLDVAGSRQSAELSGLDLRELISTADGAGVTHLDLSTGLLPGQAEAATEVERAAGQALIRGARERVAVVAGVRGLDSVPISADADWGRAKVDASVEQSRRELGMAKFDALVMRPADLIRAGGAVRGRVLALRDEGVVGKLGVAVDDPAQLPGILADREVGYLQVPVGVADGRWSTPEVAETMATRPDLVVVARGVLPGPDHELSPVLDRAAADLGRSDAADLSVAYALGHPWVTSVSAPAADQSAVRSMTRSAARPLTPAQIAEVRGRVDAVTPPPSRLPASDLGLGVLHPTAGLAPAGSSMPVRPAGQPAPAAARQPATRDLPSPPSVGY